MRRFSSTLLATVLVFASTSSVASTLVSGKIVGGAEASPGEFPYIVSLRRGGAHWCGGSLIGPNWVLTAAHCMKRGITEVVLGAQSQSDLSKTEKIAIQQITIHPDYRRNASDYDFALIELAADSSYTPVELNDVEISIPKKEELSPLATTAGWGLTNEKGNPSRVLQKVEVPLVHEEICAKSYGAKAITDRMICAGYAQGGKDACSGDSGGPMVVYDQGRPLLVGVVSWGRGCARPNTYGVYAKVNAVIDWIRETTEP